MNATAKSQKLTLLLFVCCVVQIAACVHYWLSFEATGYLPAPFIYDKSDTFMDFFNPLYWADDSGRYTVWGSVYPPLNFLLLKVGRWLLGLTQSTDGFELRAKSASLVWLLVALYLLAAMLVMRADLWRRFNGAQKTLLLIACTLSPPILFTIERGNLIIFALGFLALALARPGWSRIFAVAILINLKPYFALFLVTLALTRRPRELVACVMASGTIFLITGMVLDDHFWLFIPNLLQFSQDQALFSARETLSFPSSLSAFSYVLRVYFAQGGNFSILGFGVGSLINVIETVKWLGIGAFFLSFALAGRNISSRIAFAATTVAISNLGVWVGGYSFIFYIALIPVFLEMKYAKLYLVAVALLLLPLDVLSIFRDNIGDQASYLSGTSVSVDWALSAGAIIRPPLNFVLMLVITCEVFEANAPAWNEYLVGMRQAPWSTFNRGLAGTGGTHTTTLE